MLHSSIGIGIWYWYC